MSIGRVRADRVLEGERYVGVPSVVVGGWHQCQLSAGLARLSMIERVQEIRPRGRPVVRGISVNYHDDLGSTIDNRTVECCSDIS